MKINILEIIVIIVAIALVFSGFRSGGVKKLASMLSLVLSVALVSAILPYVTDFIRDNTPIYDYIVAQCEEVAAEQVATELLSEMELPLTGSSASVSEYLADSDIEDGMSESWSSLSLDKSTQNAIIDSLPLPEMIKTMLVNNNNDDGYATLAVSNFQDYVVEYLATLILNVISFLVTVILVNIVLRLLIMVLDIIAHFPVIGGVNRIAGAGLGLLEALFVLWIFFLVLTVLQATEVGMTLQAMVEESTLLSWLYESNLFLRVMLWGASMFA